MNALKIFRLLVVGEIALTILSVVVSLLPSEELPPEVDAYLSGEGGSPILTWLERTDSIPLGVTVMAILIAFVVAYLASLIGLLFLKRWARKLYFATFLTGIVLYAFMGASITLPLAATVDYLLAACSGAILALLWVGPVRERFAHA